LTDVLLQLIVYNFTYLLICNLCTLKYFIANRDTKKKKDGDFLPNKVSKNRKNITGTSETFGIEAQGRTRDCDVLILIKLSKPLAF